MSARRRICVVTGTRAEYGLLKPTMERLRNAPEAELQLIVTGAHLAPGFGRTVDAIRADGFGINAEVDMLLDADSRWACASSVGLGLIGMASALQRMEPNFVLLLGDRYEILAAAQAAFFGHIPVGHIHGGEVTLGALDECIRHAVTKLSRLHFVSTAEHRRRVIQMGEAPAMVHNVGAPGLECIAGLALDERAALETRIGGKLGSPLILMTYHPATVGGEDPGAGIEAVIEVLADYPDATIIATGSNADHGGRAIMARLEAARARLGERFHLAQSLGQLGYLSAMRHADVVLGNSSSGIIEAPTMGVPTVNIGSRQDGRPRGPSVIDCAPDAAAIRAAVDLALSKESAALARQRINPYASRDTEVSRRIVELLLSADLKALRGPKPFHDVQFVIAGEV